MARQSFGGGTPDYVADPSTGRPRAGVTVTLWTAETGGTQVTDLLVSGAPATTLTSGVGGRIPVFQGPDEVYALWALAAGGTVRSRLDAHNEPVTDAAVDAGITRAEAQGRLISAAVASGTYVSVIDSDGQPVTTGRSTRVVLDEFGDVTDIESVVV